MTQQISALTLDVVTTPHIRTFHARHGRLSQSRKERLEQVLPQVDLSTLGADLDLRQTLGRSEVIIDFGCGMGDHTRGMIQADRVGVLAIDVHSAGIADLAREVTQADLTHVRLHLGDGIDVVSTQLQPETVREVHVMFPDPWPKARHHKRRLIQPEYVAHFLRILEPGGILRVASDIPSYIETARETLDNESGLKEITDGFVIPMTGYHRKAIFEGRTPVLLSYQKI